MHKIKILRDDLINKIAAGEVVDRPASIVKELVENALDAGANEIEIDLVAGGCKEISIKDNGGGIDPDDVPETIRRHATSKISDIEDLYQIRTMGFRGEALAAIASVSHFILQSKTAEATLGTRLEMENAEQGASPIVTDVAVATTGTRVSVLNLFHNLPARKSFLKNPAIEYAACLELIQAFVLAHPAVGFVLTHNGKEQLRVARGSGDNLRARMEQILGSEIAERLIHVSKSSNYGKLEAWVSPPGVDKSTGKAMFTFVNQRWLKDKIFRFAIMRGYHSHLLKGRYPVVVAHLTCEPSLVDVNVHPAKTEVKFQYAAEVQSLVTLAIREALREGSWVAPSYGNRALPPPAHGGGSTGTTVSTLSVGRPSSLFTGRGGSTGSEMQSGATSVVVGASRTSPAGGLWQALDIFSPPPKVEEFKIPWQQLQFMGTYQNCFLLFQCLEDLLVIDQHAFHERILYEKLCARLDSLGASQSLLMPEVIRLAAGEIEKLLAVQDQLAKIGLHYVRVDAEHVELQAVPALLVKRDPEVLLAELVGRSKEGGGMALSELSHDLLATLACHSAVRAGENLSDNELKELLASAQEVDFFHNCPHGRRVLRLWNREHVAKWFDR